MTKQQANRPRLYRDQGTPEAPAPSETKARIDGTQGSTDLLDKLEAVFNMAARKWGVEYLDARTLLVHYAEALQVTSPKRHCGALK